MHFLKSFKKTLFCERFINLSNNSRKHFSFNKLFINEFKIKTNLISKPFEINNRKTLGIISSKNVLFNRRFNSVTNKANNLIKFNQNENECALNIIELTKSEENNKLDENIDKNTINIYNQFMNISIESSQNLIINQLIEILDKLSLDQLTNVLESMTLWPIVKNPMEPNFYRLWSKLDEHLTKRLSSVSFHNNQIIAQNLRIAKQWYKLNVGRISRFNRLLIQKLNSPDLKLNKSQFLHLMFYLNLQREIDEKTKPHLMNRLENLINEMSLDEIGVICMTFFKTQTKLSPNIIPIIISRAINEISNETNNVIRTSILKAIRFSHHFRHNDNIQKLINKLKVLDNSELTLTHLLTLSMEASVYDKILMDETVSKICQNPHSFRAKDIERILLCLSNFNHRIDSKELKFICENISNRNDVVTYPWYLLTIVAHLCIFQFYPKDLIERCFEKVFLEKIEKTSKLDYQRHLLTVNTSLAIEKFSQFSNILLPSHSINRMHRFILHLEKSSPFMTRKTSILNRAYMSLKSQFNSKVQLCHIFPFNSYPFIILSDDSQNISYSATTPWREGMVRNRTVIYILTQKDYADREKILKGNTVLEIRLLQKVGFKVLTIPWYELTIYSTEKGVKNKLLSELEKLK